MKNGFTGGGIALRSEIERKLKAAVVNFQSASTNMFGSTTPPTFHEHDKGIYASLYVKPSKRISKIFATDREVLVLFTNFRDQQQRTIVFLKSLLEASEGRLENTLAIIVHEDPEGNAKLKKWGREQGVSVLPIHVENGLVDADSIERELLHDFFSNDPFDVTGPVFDDARFYGRRSEAVDIARQLQLGQIKSCLGIRKIGKTSILTRIIHETESSHQCLAIIVDCSRDDVWEMSGALLMESIALSIGSATDAACRRVEVTPANAGAEATYVTARGNLARAVRGARLPVIVFFDEVDYITPGSPTSPQSWRGDFNPFWRNLRAVYQQCARDQTVLSIFVSGVSSYWFSVESVDGIENAALAFVPEDYLSPLASGASAAMVRTIAKTAGLAFDESTAEYIGESCGHMPYWTRKAGSYIHRSIDVAGRPLLVPRESVDRLIKEFVEVEGAAIAEVALSHLFKVYPDLYAPAKSVACGGTHKKTVQPISTLIRYGVLKEKHGVVSLGSVMIEAGMDQYARNLADRQLSNREEQEAGSKPIQVRGLGMDTNEWADELAQIGAARNILERKLRALALNFIKFSSISTSSLGVPSVRISKALQGSRSSRFKHLPADDLIEKLLWTELVGLVEREWTLFAPVFNDKRLFKEHCNIINDRYDAHAKNADLADVAHYRRSLRWVEDAVKRMSS